MKPGPNALDSAAAVVAVAAPIGVVVVAAVARATGAITNEFLPVRSITALLFRTTPVTRALSPSVKQAHAALELCPPRGSSPEGRLFQPLFTGVESRTMDDPECCAEWTFAGGVVSGGAAKQLPNACQSKLDASGALSRQQDHARRVVARTSLGVGLGLCIFFLFLTGCSAKKAETQGLPPDYSAPVTVAPAAMATVPVKVHAIGNVEAYPQFR